MNTGDIYVLILVSTLVAKIEKKVFLHLRPLCNSGNISH